MFLEHFDLQISLRWRMRKARDIPRSFTWGRQMSSVTFRRWSACLLQSQADSSLPQGNLIPIFIHMVTSHLGNQTEQPECDQPRLISLPHHGSGSYQASTCLRQAHDLVQVGAKGQAQSLLRCVCWGHLWVQGYGPGAEAWASSSHNPIKRPTWCSINMTKFLAPDRIWFSKSRHAT